jgi:hypothetical protein
VFDLTERTRRRLASLCLKVLGHRDKMNAHLLQPRLAPIPPPATSTTTVRRNPLSNAINTHVPPEVPPKPASYEKKPSPPLPRQNAKVQPPSPPQVIQDKTGSLRFQRMSFLGEVSAYLSSRHLVLTCPILAGRVR